MCRRKYIIIISHSERNASGQQLLNNTSPNYGRKFGNSFTGFTNRKYKYAEFVNKGLPIL